MPDCDICVEKYNKTKRKQIICNKCEFICCKECFKTYILDSNNYFTCMSCKYEFTRKDIYEMVGSTFISKEYVTTLKNIVFDMEKEFFLDTQNKIIINDLEEAKKNLFKKFNDEMNEIINKFGILRKYEIIYKYSYTEIEDGFVQMNNNIVLCRPIFNAFKKYNTKNAIENLVKKSQHNKIGRFFNIDEPSEDDLIKELKDVKKYADEYVLIENKLNIILEKNRQIIVKEDKIKLNRIVKCSNDSCLGQLTVDNINENLYICPINDSHITCINCNEKVIDSDHECDPNIILNIRTIRNKSKPCPKCATPIQRSYGCNQMFCTECKTIFDWATLKIEIGARHNPVYLEWIAKNPNNINLVNDGIIIEQMNRETDNCGENIHLTPLILSHIFNGFGKNTIKLTKPFFFNIIDINDSNVMRVFNYIIGFNNHINGNNYVKRYDFDTNLKKRMEFMKNRLEEKDFISIIYSRYKKIEYQKEYNELLNTYATVTNDMLNIFLIDQDFSFESINNIILSITNFYNYIDDEFKIINKFYGYKHSPITKDYWYY